ncbi:MAG: hypothetical protein UV73_C0007G0010 [Candidatus Gottesmanbacteria bacterium GW2011_GWA2_43_14]|uniref:Uncharacterized protein n=1 Tax=Candidatus Gottesmanbacteria bacterium GW2011_GWA2_43_14 TaxID=1618443 RepID=A0A0G1DIZ7_9BACT|nr:MAG: hypothetical protein UV73_C0007G0010 [Candidatus Gottesmanbacteria bacterium GW2011_GWA2_43_14]
MKTILSVLFLGIFFLYLLPGKTYAQSCTGATIDKAVLKVNETVTFKSTSDIPVNNFYFLIRNLDFKEPGDPTLGQVVCTNVGGDVVIPTTDCPAGQYPLIFKDPTTTQRTTGTRTVSAAELFITDLKQNLPLGSKLKRVQIVPYMAQDSGSWSPTNSACFLETEEYRPAVCQSSSISGGILSPSQSLQITISGLPPAGTAITNYQLFFYNRDNLYGPGNPKPIIFGGQHYNVIVPKSGSTSHTFTVYYDDLNRPDELWGNKLPLKVQVNGYFILDDTGFSSPQPACVVSFTIDRPANTPTPSSTPPPGATPIALPKPAWYSPDGEICNHTNYISYFTDVSCNNLNPDQRAFSVDGINPQGQCSTDGSGHCFRVAGQPINRQIASYWRYDSQACVDVTSPYSPPNTFDILYECRYGTPPNSEISGEVILNFTSKAQFDSVYVWINDVRDNYLRKIEIPKAGIQSGVVFPYRFNNLFPDRKYDVYVKAYGPAGVVIENIDYMASCQASVCQVNPPAKVDITAEFPDPLGTASVSQSTNEVISSYIDQYRQGTIDAIELSLLIEQIQRVPGLQKATCDPKVTNGCAIP